MSKTRRKKRHQRKKQKGGVMKYAQKGLEKLIKGQTSWIAKALTPTRRASFPYSGYAKIRRKGLSHEAANSIVNAHLIDQKIQNI